MFTFGAHTRVIAVIPTSGGPPLLTAPIPFITLCKLYGTATQDLCPLSFFYLVLPPYFRFGTFPRFLLIPVPFVFCLQAGKKPVRAVLWVSADGLRVVDDKTKVLNPSDTVFDHVT